MPQGLAQQPEAQSAALRHWPPINCRPLPLPTFFAPAGSKAGPPTHWALAPPLLTAPLPAGGVLVFALGFAFVLLLLAAPALAGGLALPAAGGSTPSISA